MNEKVRKMLEKQMSLLHEKSKSAEREVLTDYTTQMINLAMLLDPDLGELPEEGCYETASGEPVGDGNV